jgi:asparagine synthase (glutamine-hydrolysing)
MTALAGFWAFRGASDPLAQCQRMLKAQQVYGPERPVSSSEGDIALGKRLFRTVPEDIYDCVPVIGGAGRWTLVADVRLDDREGLCAELGIASAEAARLSDSHIVMRAVERWEEGAFSRLVGDFAAALWDRQHARLILARDFMGRRPLHLHRGSGFFAFASMPKGLHALPEVPNGPDEVAVAQLLALLPEQGPRSFFEGIQRVLPGEMLTVTAAGSTSSRHWAFSRPPLRLKRAEEYDEALRESFDRAVESRLRGAGGRVASHLSGGLDSSAVSATAARLLGPEGKVTAFTSVPGAGRTYEVQRGRFADEGPHAAAVAALYPNIEHVPVRTRGRSPFSTLDRSFFLHERPVLNLCNHVWIDAILDEAKQRGLGVLLTGEMGNMSFSYTGLTLLPNLLAKGRLWRLLREAVLLRRHGITLESVAANTLGPFLPAGLWQAINRWRGRPANIADYSAIRADRAAGLKAESDWDFAYRPWRDSVAMRLTAFGGLDPANYQKGILGGWGVDSRDPTADRRLIELCLSIPDEQYLSKGYTRALARRAFADRLPQAVVRETRKGLQAADWYEGLQAGVAEGREEVERLAALPAAAATLDTQRMKSLLEHLPEGGWQTHETQGQYRLALLRGVSAGHFLRKATGAN